MNKKGAGGIGVALVIGIFLMVAVVGFVGYSFLKTQAAIVKEVVPTPEVKEAEVKLSAFCSNNPDVDWEVKARNTLKSTSEYLRGTMYLADTSNGNIISEQSITTITSARSDLTNAFKCGHTYEVYPKSMQDANYTAWVSPLTLSASDTQQDPVIKDIEIQNSTGIYKIRCYDDRLSAWMYDNSSTSNTADKTVYGGYGVNFTSTTGAGTNMALGNNEDFDVTCEIRTAEDVRFGLNVILGLDYSDETDPADWKDANFKVEWKGASVSEFSPVENDRIALTGSEKFWKLTNGFNEDYDKLHIIGKTESTATIDRNLVLRTVGTGTYLSDVDNTVLLHDVGFRNDGSTRTEIVTSGAKRITFLID